MNPFDSLLESYGKLRKKTYKFSTSELLSEGRVPTSLQQAGITSPELETFKNIVYKIPRNIYQQWYDNLPNANVNTIEGEASKAQAGDIEKREGDPNLRLHSGFRTPKVSEALAPKLQAYLEYLIEKGGDEEVGAEEEVELSPIEQQINDTMLSLSRALDESETPGSYEQMENKLRFLASDPGQKLSTDLHKVLSKVTGNNIDNPSTESYSELLADLKDMADISTETVDGCIPNNSKTQALRNKFFIGSPGRAKDALMYGNLSNDSSDNTNDTEPLLIREMRGFESDLGLDMQGAKAFENYQGVLVAPGRQSAVRNLGVKLSNMKMCDSDENFLQRQTTVSPTGGFYKVRGELNEMSVKLTKVILATQQAKARGDEKEFNRLKDGLSDIFSAIGQAIDVKRETLNKLADMSMRLDANINGEGFNHPLLDHAISDVQNFGSVFSDLPDLVKVAFSMAMKDAESVHWKAIVNTGTLDDVTPVSRIGNIDANKLTGPLDIDAAEAIGGGAGDTNKADSFLSIGSQESRQKICDELGLSNSERARIMATGLLPISDKFATTSGERSDLGNQSLDTLNNDDTWEKLTAPLIDKGADSSIVDLAKAQAKRIASFRDKHAQAMSKDAPTNRAPDSTGAFEFQNTRASAQEQARIYSQEKYGAQHPIKKMADKTLELMSIFNDKYKGIDVTSFDKYERREYNNARRDIVTNLMHMDEMDYLEKLSGPQREREDKAFSLMTALAGTDTNPFSILNAKNYSDESAKQVTSSQIREVIAGMTTGDYTIDRKGFTVSILKGNKPILTSKIRNRKGAQTTTCNIESDDVSKL